MSRAEDRARRVIRPKERLAAGKPAGSPRLRDARPAGRPRHGGRLGRARLVLRQARMADGETARSFNSARAWLIPLALLVAVAIALMWQITSRSRAPNPKRGELYQRTLENVREFCDPQHAGLESYCRDQATALLEFPECDPACVSLARRIRREPTR
jgi:hypothetical protein